MNITIGVVALICFLLSFLSEWLLHIKMEHQRGGFDGIQAALYLIAAAVAFH